MLTMKGSIRTIGVESILEEIEEASQTRSPIDSSTGPLLPMLLPAIDSPLCSFPKGSDLAFITFCDTCKLLQ